MDTQVQKSLLYDFYGHLLTPRQRELFRLYDEEDLSLGEISERLGVSRQAVYDILQRAEGALVRYESKLRLLARHLERQSRLRDVQHGLQELAERVGDLSTVGVREELLRLNRALSKLVQGG